MIGVTNVHLCVFGSFVDLLDRGLLFNDQFIHFLEQLVQFLHRSFNLLQFFVSVLDLGKRGSGLASSAALEQRLREDLSSSNLVNGLTSLGSTGFRLNNLILSDGLVLRLLLVGALSASVTLDRLTESFLDLFSLLLVVWVGTNGLTEPLDVLLDLLLLA